MQFTFVYNYPFAISHAVSFLGKPTTFQQLYFVPFYSFHIVVQPILWDFWMSNYEFSLLHAHLIHNIFSLQVCGPMEISVSSTLRQMVYWCRGEGKTDAQIYFSYNYILSHLSKACIIDEVFFISPWNSKVLAINTQTAKQRRNTHIFVFFSFVNSDGTLNPSGVRFGSADIYNVGKKDTL